MQKRNQKIKSADGQTFTPFRYWSKTIGLIVASVVISSCSNTPLKSSSARPTAEKSPKSDDTVVLNPTATNIPIPASNLPQQTAPSSIGPGDDNNSLGTGNGTGSAQTQSPDLGSGGGAAQFDDVINPRVLIVGGAILREASSAPAKGEARMDFKITGVSPSWTLTSVTGKTTSPDYLVYGFSNGNQTPISGSQFSEMPASAKLYYKYVEPNYVIYKEQVFQFDFKHTSGRVLKLNLPVEICLFRAGQTCDFKNPTSVITGAQAHPSARGAL